MNGNKTMFWNEFSVTCRHIDVLQSFDASIDITNYYEITSFAPLGTTIRLNSFKSHEEYNDFKVLWGCFENTKSSITVKQLIEGLLDESVILRYFTFTIYLDHKIHTHYFKTCIENNEICLVEINIYDNGIRKYHCEEIKNSSRFDEVINRIKFTNINN